MRFLGSGERARAGGVRAGLAAGGGTSADEALDVAFAGKAFLLDSF